MLFVTVWFHLQIRATVIVVVAAMIIAMITTATATPAITGTSEPGDTLLAGFVWASSGAAGRE